jgi:hypothetical protein
MPLGPQFSNTYWEDPKLKTTMSSVELPTTPGKLPTKTQRTPQIASGGDIPNNSQGMLFNPYSYTGLKDDPTVPAEQRMSTINKSLGLRSLDDLNNTKNKQIQQNKDRVEHNTREAESGTPVTRRNYRRPIAVYGDTKVMSQKNEALGKAANNLDIPTSTYKEDIDTQAKPTDWSLGHASSSGSEIFVGVRPVTNTTDVKEVQEYPASDKPIPNTKFWSQYEKQYDHPGDVHSILGEKNIHWTNPEGHTISGAEFKNHPAYQDSEEDALSWLKSNNYQPNVYPTKGKSTPKYSVGKKVSIETGYSNRENSFGYTYSPWHTRYEPDNTKEPKTVNIKANTKGGYEAKQSTLAHEIGHTQEPGGDVPERDLTRRRGKSMLNTDSVSEGYADALMDRSHTYAGQFEKHLTNTKLRAEDISTTGYSSKYHMWNATERALYAAVRFHIAAHPERIKDMQNRDNMGDSLLNWRSPINTAEPTTQLMLGHMYEHMPHVRPVLHELGFGKTSKTAHELYKSRVPDLTFKGKGKKREVYEQQNIPGM